MAQIKSTPQKGVSHVETFKVAGVTYNNRQENLQNILAQIKKGKKVDIGIEQYDYKGEPAISVTVNGLDIGNLHKKDADYLLANQDRIISFTDLHIDSFTSEDGKEIYYARVELLVKNKGTNSNTASATQQQSLAESEPATAPNAMPSSNSKKPFYKNWKFWVGVGAGLTIFYIISVILGFAK